MKKINTILATLAILTSITSLTSCKDSIYMVEIGTINMAVLNENGTTIPNTNISMYPYESYTFRYQFSYQINEDNYGDLKFNLVAEYNNVDVIDANVLNVNTGLVNQVSFSNTSGENSKRGIYTFILPEKAGDVSNVILDVKYSAYRFGTSTTSITFQTDNPSVRIRGSGQNGLTKGFEISKIRLTSPTITYNSESKDISFRHVEGATSYLFTISDIDISESNTTTLAYEAPENIAVGTILSINLDNYSTYFLPGHRYVVDVTAQSSDVNYETSVRSESISIIL